LSQHNNLRQLTTAYNELIHGTSGFEEPDVGIEQLRADAGNEGLRAKALEADALRPVIRDAGGLQAVTFLTQSARALIEQAGSLEKLNEIVLDTTMIRLRVQQLGGLQGLDQLVTDSKLLLVEQQAFAKLTRSVGGPDGLRAKALKYDRLQQAFAATERDPGGNNTPTNVATATSMKNSTAIERGSGIEYVKNNALPPNPIRKQSAKPPSSAHSTISSSEFVVKMNPARAQLLSSAPNRKDPDRYLYEPRPPPVRNPGRGMSANDEPLGRPRSKEPYMVTDNPVIPIKRKSEGPPQANVTKRPRADLGRPSALVQATLAAGGNVFRPSSHPSESRPTLNYGDVCNEPIRSTESHEQDHKQRDFMQEEVAKLIESRGEIEGIIETTLSRADRSSVESLLGPVDRPPSSKEERTAVDVRGFPIALWVGEGSVGKQRKSATTDLVKTDQIPSELAHFLSAEI
jgi:hypothetical protein